jgi:hypothetical protein
MTMPTWLKPLTKLLRSIRRYKAQDVIQSPNLPWEILYKVVDEYFADVSRLERHVGLTSIALTCHALASYCRRLVFHSVCVGSTISRPDYRQHSPKIFTSLARRSPEVLGMIRDLSLQFGGHAFPLKKSEWMMWTPILNTSFPQLQTLQISVCWLTMPERIREELLEMLKITSITYLIFNVCSDIPFNWAPYLPSSLKRLKFRGSLPSMGSFAPTFPSPNRPAVKLQALSLSGPSRDPEYIAHFGPGSANKGFLDCTSLQHLKLGTIPSADVVTNGVRSLCLFSSLQCLHFAISTAHFPLVPSRWDPPLEIGSLTSLTRLEIGIESSELYNCLEWLSQSLPRRPPVSLEEIVEDGLIIALLLNGCDVETERGRPDSWTAVAANLYSNLLMFKIIFFGVATDYFFCQYPTPVFLASLNSSEDHVEQMLYPSLWNLCVCSGWTT